MTNEREVPPVAAAAIGVLALSAAVGAGIVGHPKYATVLVAAPVLLVIVLQPGLGLLLALAAELLVPKTVPHAASLIFVLLLCGGLARRQWRRIDFFFAGWFLWTLASWRFHSGDATLRAVSAWALAASFYVFARHSRVAADRVLGVLLTAGTFGALTVFYEWRTQHLLFANAIDYQWAHGAVFRAGSIFGGAPSTGIVLAMIFLACLPLRTRRPRLIGGCLVLIAAADALTYSRAGWVGAAAGIVVYLGITPGARRNMRLLYIALVCVVALTFFWSKVSTTTTFQQGVVRSQNTSVREVFLHESLPVATDSTEHVIAGRGFDALVNPAAPDAHLRTIPDVLARGGSHDTYLTVMIEQGLIGLLLLLGWMLPTIRAGMRERSTPGLTAAVAAFTAAGVFHDLTHGLLVLLVGCLLAGLQASAVEDFAHGLVRADPPLGRDVADGKLRVVVVRPSSAV